MLLNVVCILFVVTSVSATKPSSSGKGKIAQLSPGQIVKVKSTGLMPYYQKFGEPEPYRLAVYVGNQPVGTWVGRHYEAYVVPAVPEDALSSFFPAHLKKKVTEYFGHEYPKITDKLTLKGDFDLAGYQGVKWEDIEICGSTKMSKENFNSMKKDIEENASNNDMCPVAAIKYPSPKEVELSEDEGIFKIKPGQVVTYGKGDRNRRLGVFVCWTGRGKMALMWIRDAVPDPSKSKKILESNFLGPGASSHKVHDKLDLSRLHFVPYQKTILLQPTLFLKEDLFKESVDKAVWHKSNSEHVMAMSSQRVPGNQPNYRQPEAEVGAGSYNRGYNNRGYNNRGRGSGGGRDSGGRGIGGGN